jgi:hypothetical protein
MQDIIDTHLAECDAAQAEQNAAITAASTEYGRALDVAYAKYSESLTSSRKRAWDAIQTRVAAWNGMAAEAALPTKVLLGEVAPAVLPPTKPLVVPHAPLPVQEDKE